MATISWNGTTGNWNDTAIWTGGVVPGSADTASFTGTTSGTVTVNVAVSITAFACNNPNITINMSNSITLATNGTGVFGWHGGTLNTNGNNITCFKFYSINQGTRVINLSTSTIYCYGFGGAAFWDINTTTGLTMNAGNATIVQAAVSSQLYSLFYGAGLTYGTLQMLSTGDGSAIYNTNTFTNLIITGGNYKNTSVKLYNNQTVTGALTITGNSAVNRPFIYSDTLGTQRTITLGASATFKTNSGNFDLRDIAVTGGAANELDWTTGSPPGTVGDCQGNSGVTFTAPTTCYWKHGTTNASQNWSGTTTTDGNRWFYSDYATQNRVPLPQDDVVFGSSSFGATGKTVNQDMPRMARNIDWTGATNTPAWDISIILQQLFGSLTMIPGMTLTISSSRAIVFLGRSISTFTSAGKTLPGLGIYAFNSIVRLLDNVYFPAGVLDLSNGTLDCTNNGVANYKITALYVLSYYSTARTLTPGSAFHEMTATTSYTWLSAPNTNLVFTTPPNIFISGGGGNQTFNPGYNQALFFGDIKIAPNSAGKLSFTNAPMGFNNMTMSASGTKIVEFAGGGTYTITGTQFLAGSGSGNITITSTNTTQFTLTKNSGANIRTNYVTMSYSKFATTGTVKAYAGLNSTDSGNNSNWTWGNGDTSNSIMFGDMF